LHVIACSDTHTHTHTQYLGLLWARDQPAAETSFWQHTTLNKRQTSIHPAGF